MKRMFTFMALASITMAMSAQSITVVKTEPTIGADYAGGCEIDLNNVTSRGCYRGTETGLK